MTLQNVHQKGSSKWLCKLLTQDSCQVYLLAPKAYQLSRAHVNSLLVGFIRSFRRASKTKLKQSKQYNLRKSLSEKYTVSASTFSMRVTYFCIVLVIYNRYQIEVRDYIPKWNSFMRRKIRVCIVKNIETLYCCKPDSG